MKKQASGPKAMLTGAVLGPILVGAAYAMGRNLPGGWLGEEMYLQSPLTLSFFSGLIVAFACRPVLLHIPWSRAVAFSLMVTVMLGTGPAADWSLALLIDLLGLGAFPYIFAPSILPDVLGALAAGGVMAVLFRPAGGTVDLTSLRRRLDRLGAGQWVGRVSALAVLAVVVWLFSGWLETLWAGTYPRTFTPVIAPNLWTQVISGGFEPGAEAVGGAVAADAAGEAGAAAFARGAAVLALYWLRALVLLAPLMPIALVLRGKWVQITVVFVMLLFIVGDFAPLILDQPYPSTRWLLTRIAVGAAQALLLGGVAAWLIGQIRGRET